MNRTIIRASGQDATKFLNSVTTNLVSQEFPCYALILSAQGRFLFDIFIVWHEDGYLIEVNKDTAEELIARLRRYILRSDVTLERTDYAVYYSRNPVKGYITYKDPRFDMLGYRTISQASDVIQRSDDYLKDKYIYAIPDDLDLIQDKSFPQEYGLDLLNAISYEKGCYVGQEVVQRIHTQGALRKAIFKVEADHSIDHVKSGTEIVDDSLSVGFFCSGQRNLGIAMIRTDTLSQGNQILTMGGISISISAPPWRTT
jgi:folate-binding protein YgfZ